MAAMQCFAISIALLALTSWAAGGMKLLTRQLWMDEIHSWLLITDSDSSRSLSALADGVDFNPPTWFVVTHWLIGDPQLATEFQIRLLSLSWTIISVAGLSILLTRQFDRFVSSTAILLTMSQPLLIHHSTEIRFYGFWCAGCIWMCVLLYWRPTAWTKSIAQMAGLGILSFVVCTTHYFGVFSVALMLIPTIWKRWTGWKSECSSVAIGAISGFLCFIQYLPGQKAALTRPTWISPATISDTLGFLNSLLPAWQLAVCLIALVMSARRIQQSRKERRNKSRAGQERLLPLFCLSGMPLLIVLVDWCLQPSLVTRYAMVSLPSLAIVAAWTLRSCGRSARGFACGAATLGLFLAVNHRVEEWTHEESARLKLVEQIRSLASDELIVFEDRIEWMPVLHHFPELRGRCCLVDFQNDELSKDSSLRIVQRDVGRRIAAWYPMYEMRSVNQLQHESIYYVVPYHGHGANDLLYSPSHRVERCSESVFRRVAAHVTRHETYGVTKNRN